MWGSTMCLVRWAVLIGVILGVSSFSLVNAENPSTPTVRAGKQVSFEYTLRLDDQIVLDTNVDGEPISYLHGLQQLMPGLEKGLEGLGVGESKKIVVQPEDGYGPIDEHAFMEASRSSIPQESLHVGAIIEGQDSTGRPLYPRIKEIGETEVILDYNHPLAGKVLYFDVKVLEIKKPQGHPYPE
jgi:FKBP-type peptidyl-prolyl cis-trans isomerase SlyD